MGAPGACRFDLQPLLRASTDDVGRLVDAIAAREDAVVAAWRARCREHLAVDAACWERTFDHLCVPGLRTALDVLIRRDVDGFVVHARLIGEAVADAGQPFAAVVAHIALLRDACAAVLAGDAPMLLLLDRPLTSLLATAAEGYHDRMRRNVPDAAARSPIALSLDEERTPFLGLVGRSPAMRRLVEQLRRVAATDAPVLILGETGTGKELAARAIHLASGRRDGPFVAVNCAALPRELVESELFGYKRGAFSGAVSDRPGLFRSASGGTLLLDEITEMGGDLQAKLLRVLQEHAVRPVGSANEEPIDVRIVASTNRDPSEALRSGVLRHDVYYRLSVSTLALPPLRERPEDIPALVDHHLAALNGRVAGRTTAVRGVTEEALHALCAHPWPGNIRELFNVVENAFPMCASLLDVEHLDLADSAAAPPAPPEPSPGLTTFQENERVLIARALELTDGNKARAAMKLGISRKRLYAKIARYGLDGVRPIGLRPERLRG